MGIFSKHCSECWDYPCTCPSSLKKYVAEDEIIVKKERIDEIINKCNLLFMDLVDDRVLQIRVMLENLKKGG